MIGRNLPLSTLIARPLGLITASALTIGLLALLAMTTSKDAGAQSCQGPFTIDFAGLPAGTILGEQYAGQGVHVSGEANRDFPDALIVFDTNAPPTHDPDLAVDIGNIAIFAKSLDDENSDGLVDDPDENNYGGRAIFAFDQAVSIGAFLFVDKDHGSVDFAVAYDGGGDVLASVPIPQASNGSVQRIEVDVDGVRRFELDYGDSAGFTGIEVDCGQPSSPLAATATAAGPEVTPSPTPAAPSLGTTPSTTQTAPAVAVAGEVSAPRPTTAVLGVQALPAGGGPPREGNTWLKWASPLIVLTLVLTCSIFLKRGQRH